MLRAASALLVVQAGAVAGLVGSQPPQPASAAAQRAVGEGRVGRVASGGARPAAPLYGITVDTLRRLTAIVAGIRRLPKRPTVRIVFSWHGSTPAPPSRYVAPLRRLDAYAGVMGELLDSSFQRRVSPSAYKAMVQRYLDTLGTEVRIWEIGNEVNGNWTGPYSRVRADIVDAYEEVAATGARTALTLYANEYAPHHCGDGRAELSPIQFSKAYVPASVRDGLTYVFESYYPTQCSPVTYPTSARVAREMSKLHVLYPHAMVGFGEVGLPSPATCATARKAATVLAWAYGLDPELPYYVGGYFDWYALEDAFTGRRLLARNLSAAFDSEARALSNRLSAARASGHPLRSGLHRSAPERHASHVKGCAGPG